MANHERNIPYFLSDTWWYGMTQRMSDKDFERLAKLRKSQGFSAVQLVVGIPPEVGVGNPNASSSVGAAWSLTREFNADYLNLARRRVEYLNSQGITAIIYGAWGQQIEWLGTKRMKDWWSEIVSSLDDLDVMYCLTGESDIWIGQEMKLLPDKTTEDLTTTRLLPFLHPRLVYLGKRLINVLSASVLASKREDRHKKWGEVLSAVFPTTNQPIFIHVLPNMTSDDAVYNSNLLSATTVQTGHDAGTRKLLWELPWKYHFEQNKNFINLEPWYEGITGRFGREDQLYAYWVTMMFGASGYCYGAHGIWNVGNGKFLSHWGQQTFSDAIKIETPTLLGHSHKLLSQKDIKSYTKIDIEQSNGDLICVTRHKGKEDFISYIPEVSVIKEIPHGRFFIPTLGKFSDKAPSSGQLVVLGK